MTISQNRRRWLQRLGGIFAWITVRQAWSAPEPLTLQARTFSVPLVDSDGKVASNYQATALYAKENLGDSVSLEMALIPGGAFQMGSLTNVLIPPDNTKEQPVHQVSTTPFLLGVFPVTVAQWRFVSNLPVVSWQLNTSYIIPAYVDGRLPVEVINRLDAEEFCRRLQTYTGRHYRLPTEAEWEYACRAGTTTTYHFGDGISRDVSNYNDGRTRPLRLDPVGSRNAPNRFGLQEMHGTVIEQCTDYSHTDYDGAPTDGSAWLDGRDDILRLRIARGGSYYFGANSARSAARYSVSLESSAGYGFRVALDTTTRLKDPRIDQSGVTSSASGLAGPVSPGQIVAISGINVGPDEAAAFASDDQGKVPTALAATRVLFDGVPAPVLSVSNSRLFVVVPYEVASAQSTQVMVEREGQTSMPSTLEVTQSSPAMFTAQSPWNTPGGILNEDGSVNGVDTPAAADSLITLFATGEGQTYPPGINGKLASDTLPSPVLPVRLTIAATEAEIVFVGGAEGQVAGLLKVVARVPGCGASGMQPIALKVGNASSPDGTFVFVSLTR